MARMTDAERKAFATWQALAAMREIRLDVIEGDDGRPAFVVTRWNMTRTLETPQKLALFLLSMGVAIDVPGEAVSFPGAGVLLAEFHACLVDATAPDMDH